MTTATELIRGEPLPFELVIAHYPRGPITVPYHTLNEDYEWDEVTTIQGLPRREFITTVKKLKGIALCRARGFHNYSEPIPPRDHALSTVLVWCLDCTDAIDLTNSDLRSMEKIP